MKHLSGVVRAEIPKCPRHFPAQYGFDILTVGEPIQLRTICPRCGNSGLGYEEMGLQNMDLVEAVAEAAGRVN